MKFFKDKKDKPVSDNSSHNDDSLSEQNDFSGSDFKESQLSDNLTQQIITLLKPNKTLVPEIDFTANKIRYPILNEIGISDDDSVLLDKLTMPEFKILKIINSDKILVCPKHPKNLVNLPKLYCSSCLSDNIQKLHLVEHKICGHISEKSDFINSSDKIEFCPFCKKDIHDINKEIRFPAMWYFCNSCNSKFDDVITKLYCYSFRHDFDIHQAVTVKIPHYALYSEIFSHDVQNDMFIAITPILEKQHFTVSQSHAIKGKSGIEHKISFFAKDTQGNTFCIIVIKETLPISKEKMNSVIVNLFDISSTHALVVCMPSATKDALSIAHKHGIEVITGKEPNQIDKLLKTSVLKIFREVK